VGRESEKDKKAFLYSVVIKNLETGAGAPGAFMITPSEAQYAIADFLGCLYEENIFRCKAWMIDCLPTEAAGILKGQGADVSLLICLWHVFKAVIDQASKKLKVWRRARASLLPSSSLPHAMIPELGLWRASL
jgi:hypothetical protein